MISYVSKSQNESLETKEQRTRVGWAFGLGFFQLFKRSLQLWEPPLSAWDETSEPFRHTWRPVEGAKIPWVGAVHLGNVSILPAGDCLPLCKVHVLSAEGRDQGQDLWTIRSWKRRDLKALHPTTVFANGQTALALWHQLAVLSILPLPLLDLDIYKIWSSLYYFISLTKD